MKGTPGRFLRCALMPMVGLALAGSVVVGCSKDSTSTPAGVSVEELKYPGDLTIVDGGNGTAMLWWSASNNEDAFDGYSVYGMIDSSGALSKLAGSAIQILDSSGNPDQGGIANLTQFDYDPTTKLTKAGTPPATAAPAAGDTNTSDTPTVSYRPIHTQSTATPANSLLPTCKPTTSQGIATCSLTTDATAASSNSDGSLSTNGQVKFSIPDTNNLLSPMVVGSTYCFAVVAGEDSGEKISGTTSNVACITPKYATTSSIKLAKTPADTTAGSDFQVFDLVNWFKNDCVSTGTAPGCSDPTVANGSNGPYMKVDVNSDSSKGQHNASSPGPIYIEAGGSGTVIISWVTGSTAGIADLGYYAAGFSDPTLPKSIAPFAIDTNKLTDAGGAGSTGADGTGTAFSSGSPILSGGGYSVAGQSIPIVLQHVYIFATAPTGSGKAHYFWVYVKTFTGSGAEMDLDVRTAMADDTTN